MDELKYHLVGWGKVCALIASGGLGWQCHFDVWSHVASILINQLSKHSLDFLSYFIHFY